MLMQLFALRTNMSRITIINEDKAMYIDGEAYSNLDVSSMPSELHALQWFDTFGHIEFFTHPDGTTQANEAITELPSWVNPIKIEWDKAKAAKEQQDLEHEVFLNQVKSVAEEIAIEAEKKAKWLAEQEALKEHLKNNPDPHYIPQQ